MELQLDFESVGLKLLELLESSESVSTALRFNIYIEETVAKTLV